MPVPNNSFSDNTAESLMSPAVTEFSSSYVSWFAYWEINSSSEMKETNTGRLGRPCMKRSGPTLTSFSIWNVGLPSPSITPFPFKIITIM